ncbi:MAG: UDP-N-acetylmuramoyl-L-alanyl-D-glutamate--2,6-diaminopimelate ligase [Lachnospiraceae bacterium]|nr:UDP-N-acetylmuramoyl-L-alanyl-D-glutamate--2,6-diaminopimelate ligase [Lachnospiraceae bacterium]MDD3617473.1 UDP-N-acetylmuramoyl-L-alanyl-D-glutamate--2,6-diaminopimelate ligase [Lachnospiraceae bacterium]
MKLSTLVERIEFECLQGSVDVEVKDVVYDSRKVSEGSLFICIRGAVVDGHKFVTDVVSKGAKVLVVEEAVVVPEDVTVLLVKDSRYAMACISAAYFDHPAEKLKIIGITGTKGKTTTTYMVKSILENAGYKVGLIGTIEAIIGDKVIPASNTTPESYVVQQYFAQMVDAGMDCVVMEVSSQGLMLHRTAGFLFEIGIFTNIEPDHIGPNEHESFEQYMECKGMLFKQCKIGIVNGDDEHLEQVIKGHTCQIETYGFGKNLDLRAENTKLVSKPGYLGIAYDVKGLMDFPVEIDAPGKFSIYNSLTAIAICRHFKVSVENIQQALKTAKVKGRIEMVKVSDEFTLMIDYAHNAMALESLLTTLRDYNPHRLVCLFGCGGNRSKMRRYEMGEVSGKLADLTIITSDNPRDEEPQAIIDDIKTGMAKTNGKYVEIIDRKEAIAYAIHHGEPGDIVILAGKGHEDYQEIKGEKHHMDERELIRDILAGE